MSRPFRVFLVAAEPSGDAVAADLVLALRERVPDIVFAGMGGPKMAALGITSCTSIDGLSILGLTEALAIAKLVREKVKIVGQAAADFHPDIVICTKTRPVYRNPSPRSFDDYASGIKM